MGGGIGDPGLGSDFRGDGFYRGNLSFGMEGFGWGERVGIGWGLLIFGDDGEIVARGGQGAAGFAPFGGIIGPVFAIIATAIEGACAHAIVGGAAVIAGAAAENEGQGRGKWEPKDRSHAVMMKHSADLAKLS